MPRRVAIKNHIQEIQLINQRSAIVLIFMVILIILLIFRLSYLQLTHHKLYITLSKKNSLDLVPIEPTRGLIYDRKSNTDKLRIIDPINYSATNYIGKVGIEKNYENQLHGSVDYEQVENDASGEMVRTLNQIKPMPGKNLYLTIDSKLEIAIETA